MIRIISRLSDILAVCAATCVLLMMLLTSIDIAMRCLTGGSLAGAHEINESLMVAVVYLGLAYTQKKREHVSLSLLTDALPVRWGMTLRLAGQFIIIALVGWIIWRTGIAAWRSFTINEVRFGLLQIPMWPARAAIPIGFIAFLLQSLLDIPERLCAVKTGHLRADLSPKVVS